MSTEEKVELVSSSWEEYGLATALAVVELPTSTWYYHKNEKVSYEEKYAHLRSVLEKIARKHPSYGIPRVTRELRDTHDIHINHKVVQKLLKRWDLSLVRNIRRPRPSLVQKTIKKAGKRANLVAQRDTIELFEVAYTDYTELRYANGTQKAFLMPILGHVSKLAYGWAVGKHANTCLALQAWENTKSTLQALGIPVEGMIVHHDQDSVYTSHRWTSKLLLEDKIRLSYALNGAKDNPEMESFNSHFKTENRSLFLDAETLAELRTVVSRRMDYYNSDRLHSSLDYVSPMDFIMSCQPKKQV